MGQLFDKIRRAVAAGNFIVSDHADERLRERHVKLWQVEAGLAKAKLSHERPKAQPNPSIEVRQSLADGTPIRVVWAWLRPIKVAKLVTVYFDEYKLSVST